MRVPVVHTRLLSKEPYSSFRCSTRLVRSYGGSMGQRVFAPPFPTFSIPLIPIRRCVKDERPGIKDCPPVTAKCCWVISNSGEVWGVSGIEATVVAWGWTDSAQSCVSIRLPTFAGKDLSTISLLPLLFTSLPTPLPVVWLADDDPSRYHTSLFVRSTPVACINRLHQSCTHTATVICASRPS